MGYIILLWYSLGLPYNYSDNPGWDSAWVQWWRRRDTNNATSTEIQKPADTIRWKWQQPYSEYSFLSGDKQHKIRSCNEFIQKNVPERCNIARMFQLTVCYRCLADTHYGKTCPRSRQCGINACRQLHNKLLNQYDRKSGAAEAALSSSNTAPKVAEMSEPNHGQQGASSLPMDSSTSGMEEKERENETTWMVQDGYKPDYTALRSIPVMVKCGGTSIKVTALLDDASTKNYINADMAAELSLQGKTERVTVNVLNGQIKTFNTRPVEVQLESIWGNVRINVTAFTANQVTGDMEAVNWNEYKANWPHLKTIDFLFTAMRPHIVILIGLDFADMHHAVEEVRGRAGEPIARLTPLGWTCIGNPYSNDQPKFQTLFRVHFSYGIKRNSKSWTRIWKSVWRSRTLRRQRNNQSFERKRSRH